jgi:hypothetical protein
MKYLSKRTWLGSLLFLIFVGEPTVGFRSGLLTNPASFVALASLYVVLFLLYESLIVKFNLSNSRLLLLTFSIYSVVVTGLLHGEIGDYGTHSHNDLATTLIRIQCSLFPPFAYYLLNKIYKRDINRILSVKKALLIASIYVIILTPTHKFGLTKVLDSFREAPIEAWIYSILGIILLVTALKKPKIGHAYRSKAFTFWTWLLFIVALVPVPAFFIVLLLMMIAVTIVYLNKPEWRNAQL